MEKLLYESKGASPKREITLNTCGALIALGGAALLTLSCQMPSYANARGLIMVLGIAAIIGGVSVIIMAKKDYTQRAYLRIYSGYIEGRQLNPMKEFQMKYDEIYSVKTAELMMNEFLIIKGERETYSVLVNDPEKARCIINEKLDELERV